MRCLAPYSFLAFFFLGLTVAIAPGYGQVVPGSSSGDFRVNDRPGTAPPVGPPGGPSRPPDSTMFRDTFGSRSPDEILKGIDKDLGRSTLERSSPGGQPPDPTRDRPLADTLK
jgi:hypothetical protein